MLYFNKYVLLRNIVMNFSTINLFLIVFVATTCKGQYLNYAELLKFCNHYPAHAISENVKLVAWNVCSNKTETEGVINKMKECALQINISDVTLCTAMRRVFPQCLSPVVDMIEDCFPEKSKGLPTHLLKSMKYVISYICRTDGEHIFELYKSCVFGKQAHVGCEHRFESQMALFRTRIPTTKEFCDALFSLKPCFTRHVETNCADNITRETFIGLYDAMIAACNAAD